jgi:CRISPR-associated endonuclease Cas1
MDTHHTTPIPVTWSGICVVDGYGIELRVERGQLIVADGIGNRRRYSRFSRATGGLRRLVLLGHTGYVSLDALRWLADLDVGLIAIDPEGRILTTSGRSGLDEPAIRRAQAQALGGPTGNAIARDLLDRKLEGQALVAARLQVPEVVETIETCRVALDRAHSPAELLVPEAAAANAYWSAWSDLQVRWATRDASRVPAHWRTFGTRASPITGNPRLAANPPNAILNYVYALLEAEARLACLVVGLDPGLGVLHLDSHARDSLALDLMEAVRPDVDAFVLDLHDRTWRLHDFHETRQGACRILDPLTHELASSLERWRRSIGPIAEGVAAMFGRGVATGIRRAPTPLTQRHRSDGRGNQRRSPDSLALPRGQVRATCLTCGGPAKAGRRYCLACRPDLTNWANAGTEALQDGRARRSDPAHGGEAAAIRGEKWRRRRKLEEAWERQHGRSDPSEFAERILPGLANVPTRRLVEETGLTRAYCARILKGELIPHPRWWEKLRALGDQGHSDPDQSAE